MSKNREVTSPTAPSQTSRAIRSSAKPDAVGAAAVDVARAAAAEVGREGIGEHQGCYAEGERVVTHLFAAEQIGYQGWQWSVTVARAPRAKIATVSEIALLPGNDALLAPEWVPWNERLLPGDLGVGDLLPTPPDDDRLVPGYLLSDDSAVEDVNDEIGLGRVRVLSRLGREETAERWYGSDAGPDADLAKAAPAPCGTCGFYAPLAGSLGALFGACANLFAPDDGRLVSADHGCGAHSEALVESVPAADAGPVAFDDAAVDYAPAGHTPGSVSEAESEPLGHG